MAIQLPSMVCFAIALACGTPVALADNPTTGRETSKAEQRPVQSFSFSGPPPDQGFKLVPQTAIKALNIGFAHDPGQGNYDGAVGSPSDVWNFVDIGTTAVDYLRHADASSSTARVRVTRHDGEWGIASHGGIYHGYIYHNCRCIDLQTTLINLEPSRYRAYVYAHGDAPDQNAKIEVVVGHRIVGTKATTKKLSYKSAELKEGVQYVTFDFDVAAGETVRFISHRDGSDYSMFNAIQLLPIEAVTTN